MKDIDYTRLQQVEVDDVGVSGFYFSNTIKDIMRTMTGLEVFEEKVTGEVLKEIKQQISGVIVITGPKNIMFSLSMSEYSAKGVVSSMTGIKMEELEWEDLIDGIAELVNVAAGKIKAKLCTSGDNYICMLPYTIYGDNHHIIHKNKKASLLRMYHNDRLVMLARAYFI
ncbi:MAG: chemotaxis protein CheX [Bacillota bacterium]